MMQLIVAPTAAYKLSPNHSIGISPLLAYQRFKVDGLQAFTGFSSTPAAVTDQGYDSSTGWGVHIGWMGKVSDTVTLGAAYASKMSMGKFDKYRGLFAEQGGFDIPDYNVGIAVAARSQWHSMSSRSTIDVRSVGNSYQQLELHGHPLGSAMVPAYAGPDRVQAGPGTRVQQNLTRAGVRYGRRPFATTSTA